MFTLSNKTPTKEEKTSPIEDSKSAEKTQAEEATKEDKKKKTLNPFDCPAGGPVFSDRASEEVCPVCPVCKEVEVEVGDDGHQEGGDPEVLAALGWESFFDRYG
jgi:hypothetical protein